MLYPMALAAELLPIITSDNLLQKYAFHVWKTFSFGVKKGFYQERQKDDFFRFFPPMTLAVDSGVSWSVDEL